MARKRADENRDEFHPLYHLLCLLRLFPYVDVPLEPSFFLCGFLCFSKQDLQRLQQILVHDVGSVEMGQIADQLQNGARQGYAQDGADAELAAQQPSYEGHDAPHDHRHGPDGDLPEALAQRYQQRIPWTAAQPLGDIDTHGSVHYDKA